VAGLSLPSSSDRFFRNLTLKKHYENWCTFAEVIKIKVANYLEASDEDRMTKYCLPSVCLSVQFWS